MTRPNPAPKDELRGLVDAICDDRITDEQMARLEELVLESPAAEAFYIRSMLIQSELIQEFGGAVPIIPEERQERPIDLGFVDDCVDSVSDDETHKLWPRWRPGTWRVAGIAAAAILVIASSVLLRPQARMTIDPPSKASIAEVPTSLDSTVDVSTGLATAIDLDSVAWDSGEALLPSEGELLKSRRLRLRSGRVTLAFLSGVMLTAEGPADLELVSLARVVCHKGRLRVRVPRGAEGFTVVTPGSAVVDLGTEFGVNVGDDGKARVMVFEGQAEIMGRGLEGVPNRVQRVVQSRSFESDPRTGDIRETVPDSKGFVASADLIPPLLELSPEYSKAVLESRPWGYWRFEDLSSGEVVNEVPGGLPLLATGPIVLGGDERNRCAFFKSNEIPKYFAVDKHIHSSGEKGYSLELWAMMEQYKHATLVALSTRTPSDKRLPYGHLSALEITVPGQWPFVDSALFRFLDRRPPGNDGGMQLYNDTPYIPYRWRHLVAQSHGDRMELFIDGALVRTQALDHRGAIALDRIVLGRQTELDEPTNEGRHFPGWMDEVAVYFRPLSAETIRRHYQLATQHVRPR